MYHLQITGLRAESDILCNLRFSNGWFFIDYHNNYVTGMIFGLQNIGKIKINKNSLKSPNIKIIQK
jgi:hypothetical protein